MEQNRLRIDKLRENRGATRAAREMHWIQLHIQNEQKRASNKSKLRCACRKAPGKGEECTQPGDSCHWLHLGNDMADGLAKEAKGMEVVGDHVELMKGEGEYVLANEEETAQGEYREWIKQIIINKYVN